MTTDGSSIYVNYTATSGIVDDLTAADNSIQGVLSQLQDVITPLQATWSGASDDEYTTVQNRWNSDMTQMQALLPKLAATLDGMSNNYSNTDNKIASQWAQQG
jgi:early secretory antigenic target protein ESAT-6